MVLKKNFKIFFFFATTKSLLLSALYFSALIALTDNLIGKWSIGGELRPSPGGFQSITSSDDPDEKFYDLEDEHDLLHLK